MKKNNAKKSHPFTGKVKTFLNDLVTVNRSAGGKGFSLSPSSRPPLRRHLSSNLHQKPMPEKETPLPPATTELQQWLKRTFHVRRNPDFVLRTLHTHWGTVTLAFYSSVTNSLQMQESLIVPLLQYAGSVAAMTPQQLIDTLPCSHLTKTVFTVETALDNIVQGTTFLHVDGMAWALAVDLRDQESRSIEAPQTETVVPGPFDSFVEVAQKNLNLLRMRLAVPGFIAEPLPAGRRGRGPLYLLYIDGLTNPKLVREMRRRLRSLDVDVLLSLGVVEQFIQDRPYSIFSQVLLTERPDRTTAYLLEGSVAVLLEGSPLALIAPITFWSLLQSPEDIYHRWPIGVFARLLRLSALVISLFLPGLYVAVVTFHPEMIPTELMLFIAGERERVPFPSFMAVLFLELAFEYVRESALRIPKAISTTIGIVGAIIIGQAVVQAGIVSPEIIIIMSITILAGYSMPQYMLANSIRIIRIFILLLGSVLGFYGVLLGLVALIHHSVSLRSLGVPFFAPFAPLQKHLTIPVSRPFPFVTEARPLYTHPLDPVKSGKITRPWDKTTLLEAVALRRTAPGNPQKDKPS
ncbi:spore germination protein [Heliophilum fasciatum]|uniref:Spore germination protein KA n=1 Tax=Heliophilum fasciatum TaxID=35700 RepID=A0A4R2S054_9FIRM|nr:spore germination protein [Heliophilum fasciatum]MCW2276937.1 spore germination protein KA [Heliophilum fasciatum]TCP68537.1 spore germination protein KA [Heliophilum fasciatum]